MGPLGTSPLLRAALEYAAAGIPVLPLHSPTGTGCSCRRPDCDRPGKHPRWHRSLLRHGLHDASTRPELIRRWWTRWPDANLALRTGDRFDVCDVDQPGGVAALRALVRDRRITGPVVRTGSGGWHLYLRPTGAGNRTGLLPGVDWRGAGGYVVAPPSRHASGRDYRWIRPPEVPLADCPPELTVLLFPPAPPARPGLDSLPGPDGGPGGSAPGSGDRVRHPGRYASVALAAEADTVAAAVVGTRNSTLYRAAYHLGQLAALDLLDDRDITAVLADAARRSGLGRYETIRTIRSGLRTGRRHPRLGLAA
ncbi:bifunctional DNA primase/polymerase [Micromonospora sp. WMMD1102]|uniref:bifunctional DNA primase/polymerase n=1 Tax=Micromonospora sp. WMMD1102 TaxID=3016105 RepID=UPI0024151840|nr:bifunctional DNA primase/polymerase [Micromonospora sp. WMMD1102]MDG4788321.1 bifunctional DNA primase/polymerase [Micromonospora sp. WMMD1102]